MFIRNLWGFKNCKPLGVHKVFCRSAQSILHEKDIGFDIFGERWMKKLDSSMAEIFPAQLLGESSMHRQHFSSMIKLMKFFLHLNMNHKIINLSVKTALHAEIQISTDAIKTQSVFNIRSTTCFSSLLSQTQKRINILICGKTVYITTNWLRIIRYLLYVTIQLYQQYKGLHCMHIALFWS